MKGSDKGSRMEKSGAGTKEDCPKGVVAQSWGNVRRKDPFREADASCQRAVGVMSNIYQVTSEEKGKQTREKPIGGKKTRM